MKKRRKPVIFILITALLLSLPLPVLAEENTPDAGAAETGGASALSVSASAVAGDINGAVVGIEKCQSGGYYVLATKNQSSADGILESDGLYLYKYDEGFDRKLAEYTTGTGGSVPADYVTQSGKKYPIYVDTPDWTYIGDDYGNAAFSQDSEGNLYIAYKAVDYRQLRALSEICQYKDTLYPECTCDVCDPANLEFLGVCYRYAEDGNGGQTLVREEDCPVCNAWHECYDTGQSTKMVVRLTVEKLNSSLTKVAEYSTSYELEEKTVTLVPSALTPYTLTVDDDGSVIVGGMSDKDFLKEYDPVLSYDDFRNDATPESAQQTVQHARGFLLRLDPELKKIEACTYLGGMNVYNGYVGGDSFVLSTALDSGVLYAAGGEYSGLIPTSEGVLQKEHAEEGKIQKTRDAFIAKLDPETLRVTDATYYGGSNTDYITKIVVRDGTVYAAGMTMSADLKTSSNAYQRTLTNASSMYFDNFVMRLSDSLKYDSGFAASYLGGTAREDLFDMDVNDSGQIAVTGHTYDSGSYPTTDGSVSGSYFISIFNNDCSALVASSLVKNGTGRIVRFASDGTVITGGMAVENNKYQAYVAKMDANLSHGGVMSFKRLEASYSLVPVYLGEGDLISLVVTFDNPVIVTGEPRIRLNLKNADGENCYAVYTEPTEEQKESDLYYGIGLGQKKILFTYEIKKGDTTGGELLNCTGSDALELNGGVILPMSGGTSNFDLSLPMDTLGLTTSYVYVDTEASRVTSVTADVPSGAYGVGSVIPIEVAFDGTVSDILSAEGSEIFIGLNNGGKAYYDSTDEETGNLIFRYTVGESDQSTDLLSYTGNIVVPEGSHICDAYGTDVSTDLPAPDEDRPMGAQIEIDIEAASVVSVSAKQEAGAYKKGDTIQISVEFDRPVTTTGKAELTLNTDPEVIAEAPAVSGSKTLEFTYTVGEENTASGSCLDYVSRDSLSLEDGASADSSGHAVSLSLPEPGTETSLGSAGIVIDTVSPAVQRTNRNSSASGYYKESKYYKAGETLALEAQFSENVVVKEGASPYVTMETELNGSPLVLTCQGYGQTQRSLVFTYTVKEGDTLSDAVLKNTGGEWYIAAQEGDITDEAGNAADLKLNSPQSSGNVWSGIYFDTRAPQWTDGGSVTASYTENQNQGSGAEISWSEASDDVSGLDPSGIYQIYRDGELLDSTNAQRFIDWSAEADQMYRYSVTAVDRAGNESEPLEFYYVHTAVSDTRYSVISADTEGLEAVSGSDTNDLNVLEDTEKTILNLSVSPQSTLPASDPVTVLWTQMRGNKLITYGSERADPSDTANLSAELKSLKKGDVIKVFILKDPLSQVKGTLAEILNASGGNRG